MRRRLLRVTVDERLFVNAARAALNSSYAGVRHDAADSIADALEDHWEQLSRSAQEEIITAVRRAYHPVPRWTRFLELCELEVA